MRWLWLMCFTVLASSPALAANDGDNGTILIGLIIVVIAIAIYFLPATIGGNRGINASGALFFVNLFFGWTLIGWLFCLIWAVTGATKAQDAFYARAAGGAAGAAGDRAYQEAYARERARLDHEAAQQRKS